MGIIKNRKKKENSEKKNMVDMISLNQLGCEMLDQNYRMEEVEQAEYDLTMKINRLTDYLNNYYCECRSCANKIEERQELMDKLEVVKNQKKSCRYYSPRQITSLRRTVLAE